MAWQCLRHPRALLTASTDVPDGAAVNGSGGVFFTNGLSSYVGEIPPGVNLTQLTLFSGLTLRSVPAFDASGNLFVTDGGGSTTHGGPPMLTIMQSHRFAP